jgi:hypothetical protein
LEKFTIGPNPTYGLVTINNIQKGDVTITSMSGQEIFKGLVSDNIDLTNYPAGMYILQIINDEGMATVKLEKK